MNILILYLPIYVVHLEKYLFFTEYIKNPKILDLIVIRSISIKKLQTDSFSNDLTLIYLFLLLG